MKLSYSSPSQMLASMMPAEWEGVASRERVLAWVPEGSQRKKATMFAALPRILGELTGYFRARFEFKSLAAHNNDSDLPKATLHGFTRGWNDGKLFGGANPEAPLRCISGSEIALNGSRSFFSCTFGDSIQTRFGG